MSGSRLQDFIQRQVQLHEDRNKIDALQRQIMDAFRNCDYDLVDSLTNRLYLDSSDAGGRCGIARDIAQRLIDADKDNISSRMKRYLLAQQWLEKAESDAKSIPKRRDRNFALANVYKQLSDLYHRAGDEENWLKFLKKSNAFMPPELYSYDDDRCD